MAMTITVELNDLEEKCMRVIAVSPEDWVKNLVASRVFAAKQDIYQAEVQRMTADPSINTIPADIDTVVMQAEVRYADEPPELPTMSPTIA
jgi:UDP-3-O-acyl-N-acetylglucosamine deacetylase